MPDRLTKGRLEAFLCEYRALCLKHGMVADAPYGTIELNYVGHCTDFPNYVDRCVEYLRADGDYTLSRYKACDALEAEQKLKREGVTDGK